MPDQVEPIPQQVDPQISNSPRIVIDTSILEDPEPIADSVKTPEQLAQEKRLEERTAIAKSAIDTILPPKTLDDYRRELAEKYNKSISDLDSGDELEAKHNFEIDSRKREFAAKDAAISGLSDDQIKEYIRAVTILKRAAGLREILPDKLDNWEIISGGSVEMIDFLSQEAEKWNDRFKDKVTNLSNPLINIVRFNTYPVSEIGLSKQEISQFLENYARLVEYRLSLPPEAVDAPWTNHTLGSRALDVALRIGYPDQILYLLDIAKRMPNGNQDNLNIFSDEVSIYASHHKLDENSVKGLTEKLLPLFLDKDPRVELLQKPGNIWAMSPGEFGAGDFLMHAFASTYSPLALADLSLALRSVPTTNAAMLERNRLDAPTLDSTLREIVHDERPYVHELLAGGLIFYETGDMTALELAAYKGKEYERGGREHQVDTVFRALSDKSFYERTVDERIREGGDYHTRPAYALDIYKRLVENTKPVSEEAPSTEDQGLNEKLKAIETSADTDTLQDGLKYYNDFVMDKMQTGEIGIDPSIVHATAWLERKLFKQIQGLSYEDQQALYKKPWFIDALRFQDLTQSASPFDSAEFDKFITEIQLEDPQHAMKKIASRTLNNTHAVNRALATRGIKNTISLWTGNFTHELIGLGDQGRTITEQGRKMKLEEVRRKLEPGYHPGD